MITWNTYKNLVSIKVAETGNVWLVKGKSYTGDGFQALILHLDGNDKNRIKVDVLCVNTRIETGEWIPQYK